MSLGDLYDTIAKYYANIDFFKINSSALQAAIEQLHEMNLLTGHNQQVLDLGSGDGKLLALIHEIYPQIHLIAVDTSADMLDLVKAKIPQASTVKTSITDIHRQLPAQQFDLVIAGFVCSYVGLPVLLTQADYLLKADGYFMLITTTQEAFAAVQEQVQRIGRSLNPWRKLLYFWMKKTLRKVKAPQNFAEIERQALTKGFTVAQRRQLITPVVFNNSEEARQFAENGGWAISLVDYAWMPTAIFKKIALRMLNYISFPFHDKMIVEVVLLKKKDAYV